MPHRMEVPMRLLVTFRRGFSRRAMSCLPQSPLLNLRTHPHQSRGILLLLLLPVLLLTFHTPHLHYL